MTLRSRKIGRSFLKAIAIMLPNAASMTTVKTVRRQLRYNRTPIARTAEKSPPTSCTIPVPTRFRIPSASVMMREMSCPVLAESKYETGRRSTWCSTSMRMFVIARWAVMLTTCDRLKDVIAWMIVAAPASRAMGSRSWVWRPPSTSSMTYLVLNGRTIEATRLISIRTRPIDSERRWCHISARASAQARFMSVLRGFLSGSIWAR